MSTSEICSTQTRSGLALEFEVGDVTLLLQSRGQRPGQETVQSVNCA